MKRVLSLLFKQDYPISLNRGYELKNNDCIINVKMLSLLFKQNYPITLYRGYKLKNNEPLLYSSFIIPRLRLGFSLDGFKGKKLIITPFLPLTPQNFSNFKKSTCSKDMYKRKNNRI